MHLDREIIEQKLTISHDEPKKFVFDLDGTIIFDGKPLEPAFEKILLDIHSAGHEIIFATGRSWRDFVPVLPKWCSNLPSVVFGGGLAVEDREIKYQHFLPEPDLQEIVKFLEDKHISYLVDGHSDYYHPPKEHWLYQDIVKLSGQHKTHSVENIIAEGAYKVLVLEDKWLEHFNGYIKDKNLIIKYHFYDKCFDIMPAHVNKYRGLCELRNLDVNNIFVFGNDHNDLELMQSLPNSILFGNHNELLKLAKIRIDYDDELITNFATVVNTILKK